MKLCPCGYHGDINRACTCHPARVREYRNRVSGPLLDRIDIQVEVPAVPFKDLSAETNGPSSAELREVVVRAREVQQGRLESEGAFCNAQMNTRLVRRHCALQEDGVRILEAAMDRFKLSARAYGRILKIARTIADLDEAKDIGLAHVSEAISYRSLDRETA